MDKKHEDLTKGSQRLFERLTAHEIKLSRTKTWGGLETKPFYGPAAAAEDYASRTGDPGTYPYTRGAYPQMYRSRMWTLRNIVGYGAPEDTREGLEKVLAAGGSNASSAIFALNAASNFLRDFVILSLHRFDRARRFTP